MPMTRCVNSRSASGSTGSIIWVLDVQSWGSGIHGEGGIPWVHGEGYGIPPSPNIQHPNNTACEWQWLHLVSCMFARYTEFPRLDALHVLDASARFNAGCSGRQTF